MSRKKDQDPWETGALGRSAAHARVADPRYQATLDESLDLQLVSIRLQKQLVGDLKQIAAHHGIAYQPMIRDLLNRFAASEMQHILEARLQATKERAAAADAAPPVARFLEAGSAGHAPQRTLPAKSAKAVR